MTLQAPTAAAIVAGVTTEEVLACTGGLVVYIVCTGGLVVYIAGSGGHWRRMRRPQVTFLYFLALQAPTAAIAAGGTTEEVLACTGGLVVYIVDSGGQGRRMRRPQVSLGRACGLL